MYQIIVWNDQGASEAKLYKSIAQCKKWLVNTWADPEKLKAEISESGLLVQVKPMGKLTWEKQ